MKKKYFVIAAILVLLAVGFLIFLKYSQSQRCECVKVQTTCCPCSMGGQEKCVLKSEVGSYPPKNCSINLICAAVDNCRQNICECSKGKCDFKE
jgi:hypothetical protein